MGETLAEQYCRISKEMRLTILRPTQLYDEHLVCKAHQPLLFHMISRASKGEDFILHGSNPALRNFLYLDDFIGTISRIIDRKIYGSYNCLGESNNLVYFANIIYSVFKRGGAIHFDKDKPNVSDMLIPSTDLISELFDESPLTSFKEGITKIYRRIK